MTADRSHVLQLDFAGLTDGESLRALRDRLGDTTVSPIDPLRLNTAVDEFTSLEKRVERIVAQHGSNDAPIVLQAYCTGTALAGALADRLAADGRRVRLIQLFNPEAVTSSHVIETFCELSVKLGNTPEQSEAAARAALDPGLGRREQLRLMRGELRRVGAGFARSLGVPDDAADAFGGELIDRYCAWINFLLSSIDAPFPPAPAPVLVYRTRQCPALAAVRAAAAELRDRSFDAAGPAPMADEWLLAAAVDDLRGVGAEGGRA